MFRRDHSLNLNSPTFLLEQQPPCILKFQLLNFVGVLRNFGRLHPGYETLGARWVSQLSVDGQRGKLGLRVDAASQQTIAQISVVSTINTSWIP